MLRRLRLMAAANLLPGVLSLLKRDITGAEVNQTAAVAEVVRALSPTAT